MANVVCGEGGFVEPSRKRQKLSPSIGDVQSMDEKLSSDSPLQAHEATMDERREAELGIRCYVNSSHVGFVGIFKQRYTDFCVNEVDLNGIVVHLTDVELPGPKPQRLLHDTSSKVLESIDMATSAGRDDTTPNPSLPGNADSSLVTSSEPLSKVTGLPCDHTPKCIREANDISGDETANIKVVSKPTLSPGEINLLDSYFGIHIRQSITELYERVVQNPEAKSSSLGLVVSEPITARVLRTTIHKNIRRIFQRMLKSSADVDGIITIYAAHRQIPTDGWKRGSKDSPPNQAKGKLGWQELGGKYLHFSLYKENKDTMEVINFIASKLKIPSKQFKTAGTKDRRAVTVQRVSIPRMRADRLMPMNNVLNNAKIGNFSYEKQGLELGDLTGNEFQITLRNCVFHDIANENGPKEDMLGFATAAIGTAIGNLQRHGFINYYGLQRFGTHSVGTHEVGKLILKGDYEGAVDAILAFPSEALVSSSDAENVNNGQNLPGVDVARALAIAAFKTKGDITDALETLPGKFVGERHVMKHLQHKPKSFIGALTSIPRNLKTMYVHAYQSLVWNMAASKRWDRYGANVVKGDLIIDESAKDKSSYGTDLVDEDGDIVLLPDARDMAVARDDLFERARSLTKKEAASGKYTIFDIVLPTPGYDINYPDNDIGDYYKEFMGSEKGGGLDPAKMRRPQKDFSLSGSYRKLIARIGNDVSFQVKFYSDENEQFVQTDLEKIQMKPELNHEMLSDKKTGDSTADERAEPPRSNNASTDCDQKKMAVILKFQLTSSVYATMALRELMKRGGAKAFKPEFSSTR